MNGIGNAILVVDLREGGTVEGNEARRLGAIDGFGFDQLMAIEPPRRADAAAFVSIYNADGSRAGACGNGTRCVAWFLLEATGNRRCLVETEAGLLACERTGDWSFTVDMGPPALGWQQIPLREAVPDTSAFALQPQVEGTASLGPASAVGMGNPHAVFWPTADTVLPDLRRIGPALEHHPMFPQRANISIARRLSGESIALDVWERGAGVTRACGSAACASIVSGVRTGRTGRRAVVHLPGGTLDLHWGEDDHVLMSGAVALEHRGRLPPGSLQAEP